MPPIAPRLRSPLRRLAFALRTGRGRLALRLLARLAALLLRLLAALRGVRAWRLAALVAALVLVATGTVRSTGLRLSVRMLAMRLALGLRGDVAVLLAAPLLLEAEALAATGTA